MVCRKLKQIFTFSTFIILFFSTINAFAQDVSHVSSDQVDEIFTRLSKANDVPMTCTSTALIWGYEIKHYFQLNAGKVFIFFSNSSNASIKHHWFFHVAPYLNVNGKITVLDKDFEKTAVPLDQWVTDMDGDPSRCEVSHADGTIYGESTIPLETCKIRIIDDVNIISPIEISNFDSGKNLILSEAQYKNQLIEACKNAFGRKRVKWSRKKCSQFLDMEL